MAKNKFYTVDLKSVRLSWDDMKRESWIQGFPVGKYNHPVWGKLDFNQKFFDEIVANFRANVRGIDPDIDYDHKSHDSKAAGWVKDVEVRGFDGLWLLVEWTEPAATAIRNGEYRYFSPEFGPYEDAKTGNTYENVLLGGGITNRPFLKELQPINLSEILSSAEPETNQGESMKELLKKLGAALGVELSEDDAANETAVLAKLNEVLTAATATATELNELKANAVKSEEDQLKELAETNPLAAKLLSEREADRKRLADLEAAHRGEQSARKLNELVVDGKKLPPAIVEKLAPLLASMPKSLSESVFGVIADLTKTGPVTLGEVGSKGPQGRQEGNSTTMVEGAYKKFNEKVDELVKSKNLRWADAAKEVSISDPDLWAQYNDSLMES